MIKVVSVILIVVGMLVAFAVGASLGYQALASMRSAMNPATFIQLIFSGFLGVVCGVPFVTIGVILWYRERH